MANQQIKNERMEAIVSLAKRRGFIYQGSDVYGGLSGTWDYGPLGVTLKRNIMPLRGSTRLKLVEPHASFLETSFEQWMEHDIMETSRCRQD